MRVRKSLVCQVCAIVFSPIGGHLKQKTCSKVCGHILRNLNGSPRLGKHYPHLQRARIGTCICGKEFRAIKDFKNRKQKYCSRKCYEINWVKNIRPRLNPPGGKIGTKNYAWKGENVGYDGIHRWIARWMGKASECWHCDTKDAK